MCSHEDHQGSSKDSTSRGLQSYACNLFHIRSRKIIQKHEITSHPSGLQIQETMADLYQYADLPPRSDLSEPATASRVPEDVPVLSELETEPENTLNLVISPAPVAISIIL